MALNGNSGLDGRFRAAVEEDNRRFSFDSARDRVFDCGAYDKAASAYAQIALCPLKQTASSASVFSYFVTAPSSVG
jgi:hypothetical protein